jgi:hypothetical protein
MRKQKGSLPAELLFGELIHLSHQIRSAGGHRATPGTIRRQRVPELTRNRRLPQCGYNKTNANRVGWGQARSPIVSCAGSVRGEKMPAAARGGKGARLAWQIV